jgi:hypothetical protein
MYLSENSFFGVNMDVISGGIVGLGASLIAGGLTWLSGELWKWLKIRRAILIEMENLPSNEIKFLIDLTKDINGVGYVKSSAIGKDGLIHRGWIIEDNAPATESGISCAAYRLRSDIFQIAVKFAKSQTKKEAIRCKKWKSARRSSDASRKFFNQVPPNPKASPGQEPPSPSRPPPI